MGTGGDSESPNCKKYGKINTGQRSKYELRQVKWVYGIWSSAEEVYVVMRTEKRR